jgi:hypothetical protein
VSDSEQGVKLNLSADATNAVAGLKSTAIAVDTVKIALTGLQKAMFVLAIMNQVIQLFQKLGAAVDWAGQAMKRMRGIETTAEALSRVKSNVDGLTDSFRRLADAAKESAEAISQERSIDAAARDALTRRQLAKLEQQTADKLSAETDPDRRKEIEADAQQQRANIEADARRRQRARETAAIDEDLSRNDAAYNESDTIRANAQKEQQAARGIIFANADGFQNARKRKETTDAQKALDEALKLQRDAEARMKALDADRDALIARRAFLQETDTTDYIEEGAATARRALEKQGRAKARVDARLEKWRVEEDDRRKRREQLQSADDARATINAQAADRMSQIRVDVPRAASAAGAIGGIMGGSLNNASRLQEQRAEAALLIQREQLTALNEIKTSLAE